MIIGREIEELPLVPLRNLVVFPHTMVPLFVGRGKSITAVEEALRKDKRIFLLTQRDANVDEPKEDDLYRVGVVATIVQSVHMPDGTMKILVEGKQRAKVLRVIDGAFYQEVQCLVMEESPVVTPAVEALMRNISNLFQEYTNLNQKTPAEIANAVENIGDPNQFCDVVATHLNLKSKEKQSILACFDVQERLEKVMTYLHIEIEILDVEKRIKTRVKEQMEQNQKEYYLNEKIKAIQKELGRDGYGEVDKFKEKIKAARMPKEVEKKAMEELHKLEMMPPMSAAATVVRNYLDWLTELPWNKTTRDRLSIERAQRILDEDHYGLRDVKDRILEYLAVRKLSRNKGIKGPILCLVGPPGVGKTSLGRSIARAMGRRFVRVSLGGVRDEAEIRGHRRTYVGALPGRIIQMMRKAGTKNPVMLLDEIDKLNSDFRGDPSSALLEVLDPEQNTTFSDHYLEVDFDLSKVFFLTTANLLHTIPRPLLDRMEVIRIPGYTEYEKTMIATQFLFPKSLKANGLRKGDCVLEDDALLSVIREYTKEAGVRNLERELSKICRKSAKLIVEKGRKSTPVVISKDRLEEFLGVPKYRYGRAETKAEVGVVNGLAWTENGGELLITEVSVVPGKGELTLTGKLGEVMQESAKAALTYVRSRSRQLNIDPKVFGEVDIHVHLPEGAIPKDGPSAGITLATALASAITNIPVRCDVAMTGEITLRGKVMPIGGLKEKLLAAKRGGIHEVIIPKENERELREVPEEITKGLTIRFVESMDEVLHLALEGGLPVKGEVSSEEIIYRPDSVSEHPLPA